MAAGPTAQEFIPTRFTPTRNSDGAPTGGLSGSGMGHEGR